MDVWNGLRGFVVGMCLGGGLVAGTLYATEDDRHRKLEAERRQLEHDAVLAAVTYYEDAIVTASVNVELDYYERRAEPSPAAAPTASRCAEAATFAHDGQPRASPWP